MLEAYANVLGTTPEHIDNTVFMSHPLGVMIDDQPWIPSPQAPTEDGDLKFYCQILESMDVHVMNSTNLIEDSRTALENARAELDGRAEGAVLFSCILRRLEMDADNLHEQWLSLYQGLPSAGFHTYGESWIGHINQTCTGVVFG